MTVDLRHGNCLDILPTLPDCSVDSIVTDPPYELGFMGKKWDNSGIAYNVTLWQECLRVLKPGGHLLAFGGTRTYHRMACAIEDAGFEIRDSIHWLYGSGFPKSLDVSKAIDKMDASEEQEKRRLKFTAWVRSTGVTSRQIDEATGTNMGGHYTTAASQPAIMTREHLEACRHLFRDIPAWVERECDIRSVESRNMAEREIIGKGKQNMTEASVWATEHGSGRFQVGEKEWDITAPATEQAKQWAGWGTALKPAHESVIVARKGSHIGLDFSPVPILEVSQWLLSSANDALTSSTSNRAEWLAAMFDSVPRLAEQHPATPADLFEVTAMWLSAWATPMTLNTVSLWLNIWEEAWQRESMSTTSTASRTTTGLRTWRFLLSQITPENTPRSVTSQGGEQSLAWLAVETLSDVLLNLSDIHGLPVPESATDLWQELSRVEVASETHEPVVVARKPLIGTVAANVLEYGTGAINIDASRIGHASEADLAESLAKNPGRDDTVTSDVYGANRPQQSVHSAGRWPANVILDDTIANSHDDWPRYFYCAKPSRRERNAGLNQPSTHPTVKPLALMRYLVRLVTPPNGTVLEPFAGSGTTLMACVLEDFNAIGIEMTDEYLPIIKGRIAWAEQQATEESPQQELQL